jgi:hypothetical protein
VTIGTTVGSLANLTIGISGGTGLTIGGDLLIALRGQITCSGASLISCAGSWDSSAGTFTYSTSTVSLTGTGSIKAYDLYYAASFYNLSMAAANKTTTMGSSFGVGHICTLGTGNLSQSGTRSLGLVGSYATPLVNAGATITGLSFGYVTSAGVTVNVAGGIYGTGNLYLYAWGANVTFNFAGDVTLGGTLVLLSPPATGIVCNTQNHNLTAGALALGHANRPQGVHTFNCGSSVMDIGTGGVYVGYLGANGGTNYLNLQTAIITNAGLWSMKDTGSGTIIVDPGTASVTFDGTGTQNIYSNGQNFYNFLVNKTGSAVLIDALAATNDLLISAGTLSAAGFGITVGENWSRVGSFTHGGNTVTFNDATKLTTVTGSTTFNVLQIVAGKTVKFTAGTTTTCASLVATGTPVAQIILTNVTGTSTWALSDSAGTNSVSYCTISYSAAAGGATWLAYTTNGNVDGGGNSGWVFALAGTDKMLLMFD